MTSPVDGVQVQGIAVTNVAFLALGYTEGIFFWLFWLSHMLDVVEVMTDWNDEGQRLIEGCPGWKLEEEQQREDLGNIYRGQEVSWFKRRGCNGWFALASRQNLKVLHRWCSGVILVRSLVLSEDSRVLSVCSQFLFEKTLVHLLVSGLVWGHYHAGQVPRLWCDTWPDFTDWQVERWCAMVIYHPKCNINFIL